MSFEHNTDKFTEVYKLQADGKIEEALELLNSIEDSGVLHPRILVLKYLCLRSSTVTVAELDDLENLLNRALELDENYVPALIELAYFRMNVLDKPDEAIPIFEKAGKILKDNVTDVILGHAQCIAESGTSKSALEFIDRRRNELIDAEKLAKFTEDLNWLSPD